MIIDPESKYRTNISLGKDDLFYKGASPFQYNLESRNTSFKEVNENYYLYAKLQIQFLYIGVVG